MLTNAMVHAIMFMVAIWQSCLLKTEYCSMFEAVHGVFGGGMHMDTKTTKAFTVSKVFGIKPFKGSTESKTWTLELTVPSGTSYRNLAISVLKSEVVKVQNSKRSKFDDIKDGHVFRKTFAVTGLTIDPEKAMISKLSAMSPDERKAYFDELETMFDDDDETTDNEQVDGGEITDDGGEITDDGQVDNQ